MIKKERKIQLGNLGKGENSIMMTMIQNLPSLLEMLCERNCWNIH